MLEPLARGLLLQALRPPDGYGLDRAIGTTFSLDLLALLRVPLAFALLDWEGEQDHARLSPLALLEALRRHADHLVIFCQAGQIGIPRYEPLYGYLENSVVEVASPAVESVFHPKVWALRFVAPRPPVLYRLLVLSRNLTFDRSWDTMLVLDGQVADRRNAFARNHPLGDFFAALTGMACRVVPERVLADVDLVQKELRHVQFEPPDGFDEVDFFPLGVRRRRFWPFETRVDRMLVISPFVSADCLAHLTEKGRDHVLVSRPETLDALTPASLARFGEVKVLSDLATPERVDENTDTGQATTDNEADRAPGDSPTGLHAKVYVADAGWKAHVWTGSANATTAAFSGNVEFLVRLSGRKSTCGVDSVLRARTDQPSFGDLLEKYQPPEEPPPDAAREALERRLEKIRHRLAALPLVARVSPAELPGLYTLALWQPSGSALDLEGASARCWPASLPETASVRVVGGRDSASEESVVAQFAAVSYEAITSFFAVDLALEDAPHRVSARFILNLPLEGAPSDRRQRVLQSLLSNKSAVLRYLLFLLAWEDLEAGRALDLITGPTAETSASAGTHLPLPLFESMVRALGRDPAKLDQVSRLVDDLKQTPEGQALLPDGFDEVWEPIWGVRQGLLA